MIFLYMTKKKAKVSKNTAKMLKFEIREPFRKCSLFYGVFKRNKNRKTISSPKDDAHKILARISYFSEVINQYFYNSISSESFDKIRYLL